MIDKTQPLGAGLHGLIISLATTKNKAQHLLHRTESYLNNLGMRIAAEKCASFEIRPTRD